MKKVTLEIESGYTTESVILDEEITIGRSDEAAIALDDAGLSRVNTAIFRDGEDVLIVDENSTNGTFINGEKVGGSPKILFDGDLVTLGSDTRIKIYFGERDLTQDEIIEEKPHRRSAESAFKHEDKIIRSNKPIPTAKSEQEQPWLLFVAAGSTLLILVLAGIGIAISNYLELDSGNYAVSNSEKRKYSTIPVLVIDPLGGKKQEDLDELTQYWEVQEKEIQADDLSDISASTTDVPEEEDFNVNVEYWKRLRELALGKRDKPIGLNPPGTKVPPELRVGFAKQPAKIREMQSEGYVLPMDFADLARKRNDRQLVEIKMATPYWVLEVGGSSTTGEFTTFDFKNDIKSPVASPDSDDFNVLRELASNFSGVSYDIMNPNHRRQMKIRLLRMFHPRAKVILVRLAKAYHARFKRPLRVTSLARSMEYQIGLNKINPNSLKVRGAESRPPHTSGCAFDLARKHMTAEEQNFLMEELAKMEREGILDALREGNINACFHVFVYDDGRPPS